MHPAGHTDADAGIADARCLILTPKEGPARRIGPGHRPGQVRACTLGR